MIPVFLFFLMSFCIQYGTSRQISEPDKSNSRPVELAWGIAEVQTPIGRLFNYTIQKDAFDGDIDNIKVTEADKGSLPAWLTFDPKSRQFVGLPYQAKDVGAHYIAVTVFGQNGASVEDVFTLIVTEADPKALCSSEAAQTILTLLLDIDWTSMKPTEQFALLGKFSNYMDIQVADFKVSSVVGSGAATSLFDSSALIAGPGNVKEVKYPGIKLSSVVGCDGNLDGSRNKELTKFVEEAARDGSMAAFTGADVTGWILTTSRPVIQPRHRRQNFLNTPEPSPIIPTLVVQPGGNIQATPYLPTAGTYPQTDETSVTHGGDAEIAHGIRPTGTYGRTTAPTALVDQTGATPELQQHHLPVTPPPPTPPPAPFDRSSKKSHDVGILESKPPKPGKPIAGGMPIVAVAGDYFSYEIPTDAYEDIDSSNVRVNLLEQDDKNGWIKLERKEGGGHILKGLPMSDAAGSREYHLDVADGSSSIQIPFKIDVNVKDESKSDYNHEVEAVLSEPYDQFNLDRRLTFVDTLRSYYGDSKPNNIILRSIKAGSTHVVWTNDTLTGSQCDDPALLKVTSKVRNEDGSVNEMFRDKFAESGFKIDKVAVRYIGPCGENAKQEAPSDIYLSMVIPIVIVALLLLIACCVGCFLYRKRKRGKMSTESEQIFTGKNKPVILPGEINDQYPKGNNGASKKPTVIADERPPVPPPVYPGRSPPNTRNRAAANFNHSDDLGREPREDHPLLTMPPASAGEGRHPPKLQLVSAPSSRDTQ